MTPTIRQSMAALLAEKPLSAKELAVILELKPPEAAEHLAHLMKSHGARLKMTPASCLACGFVFSKRQKPMPPSRCPICRGHRIDGPRFRLEKASR